MAHKACPNCGFDLQRGGFIQKLRQTHPQAYTMWTPKEEDQLDLMLKEGKNVLEISRVLGRHPQSIQKRIELLGLVHVETAAPPTKSLEAEVAEEETKVFGGPKLER